jgi:hypothetical protein
MVESPFVFIAFSQDTGAMLGHGRNVAEALAMADFAAPEDALIAFPVGLHGDWFWAAKLPLHQARMAFEAIEDEEGFNTPRG